MPIDTSQSPLQTSDAEAEECFLGTLLFDPDTFYLAGWLTPDDFQIDRNRWIFEAISRRHEAGDAECSFLEVEQDLRNAGKIGPGLIESAYVMELIQQPPSYNYAEHYARRIRSARRRQALSQAITNAAGIVAKVNGVDPVTKAAGLLASIDEQFPDPDNAKAGRFSTWADLEAVIGPIEWDWPSWLARGFATLLTAEPGLGKSMLALRIAGTYLLGWPWPDGSPYVGERGRVLWCESEGAQALNLQRAQAWGLPVGNILSPTGNPLESISLEDPRHLESIRRLTEYDDLRLIVVDSFSGSNSRDENDAEAGRVIRGVAEIARDANLPLIITHHLNKSFRSNRITLTNVRGSTSIQQFVRLIWAMDKPDPDNQAIRLYGIKSNLGPLPSEIGLSITGNGMQTLHEAPKAPRGETVADQAEDILEELLNREPVQFAQIMEHFQLAGLSESAARRAKKKLGVVTVKRSDERWYWSLPARKVDELLN